MSTPAIRISTPLITSTPPIISTPPIQAPPAAPPVITPRRKGIAVALLLSLGLHAILILGLIDWFHDAPDSPSIVKATLTRLSAPPATSTTPGESALARPVAQPLGEPTATGTGEPVEMPLRPVPDPVATTEVKSDQPGSPGQNLDYAATVRQIAALDARDPAGQPRIRRIVEGRTQTAEDDWYLESWRRKVERIGRLNYPGQARANSLYGSLRLLVAIEPDGTLRDVRVVDSSGHKVLDEAAVRIVRLAAPYAPFPPGMRENTDVLEIVRTWRFQKRGDASIS